MKRLHSSASLAPQLPSFSPANPIPSLSPISHRSDDWRRFGSYGGSVRDGEERGQCGVDWSQGVMRPKLVTKSIVPVVRADVLGIYGLIIAVIISAGINPRRRLITSLMVGLSAGIAIGVVGDAGVRANAQQPKLFVGTIGTCTLWSHCWNHLVVQSWSVKSRLRPVMIEFIDAGNSPKLTWIFSSGTIFALRNSIYIVEHLRCYSY